MTRTRTIRTLVAWSGLEFSYAADDVVEVSEEVAAARIAAGLAAPVERVAGEPERVRARHGGQPAETAARRPRERRG